VTPKTFSVIAVSTVIAVIAAVVSLNRDTGYRPAAGVGEKVFPGLLQRVNDAAKVVIAHADGVITLENGAKGWAMKERQGYPARTVKIKRTVLGLAQLQLREPKTRRADKYEKLALRDVGVKGAQSKRVMVFDGAGKVLADLLIGKRRGSPAGPTGGELYVRKPGDAQTWLAAGSADISDSPESWLERKIVDIKNKRVGTVVIRHPGGETVTLSKPDENAEDFTLESVPEGRKPGPKFDLNAAGKALADLQLDDVRKDEGGFDSSTLVAAEFITFDGLFVQVEIATRDGGHWLRLKAAGEGADEITARTKGWVYKISDYAASNMTKRLKDLTEDAKPKS